MKRREFFGAVGAAVLWPLRGRAQQQTIPVIGFLNGQSPDSYAHLVSAFGEGLRDSGFIDGQNVTIEYRWANGHDERLPALAAELLSRGVALQRRQRPRQSRLYSPRETTRSNVGSLPASIARAATSLASASWSVASMQSDWNWRVNSYRAA